MSSGMARLLLHVQRTASNPGVKKYIVRIGRFSRFLLTQRERERERERER